MGYCDPKAIRDGKAWADVVNKMPMNVCPSCVHGEGFHCTTCWPSKRTIPKSESLKNQALTTMVRPRL